MAWSALAPDVVAVSFGLQQLSVHNVVDLMSGIIHHAVKAEEFLQRRAASKFIAHL